MNELAIGAITLILVLLVLGYLLFRRLQQANRLLQQQNQQIEIQREALQQLEVFKAHITLLAARELRRSPGLLPQEELLIHIDKALRQYGSRPKKPKATETSDEAEHGQTADQEWLIQLESNVRTHLADSRFNVDRLAEIMETNRKNLYRRIRACTGFSANQYIQEIRLLVVQEKIASGDYTNLNDLAASVGFRTANYLSRLYRERFGKSPVG